MICPRCSVSEISPATGVCELCGYVPNGAVAVDAPHPDATDEIARAELAHQFRIDVLLGAGPSSVVYLAREQESSGHIVLKVHRRVPGRPDLDTRFKDAIGAARNLDHPHLVPVLRNGETDSLLWYTMEHRKARTLKEIMRASGPMDLRAAMRLVTQVGAALDYLHRRGVVHGRLKPDNVLVDADNWVFVCDALVARAVHPGPTPGAAPQPRPSAPSAPPPPPRNSGAIFTPRISDPRNKPAAPPPVPDIPTRSPYSPPEEPTGILGAASDQYSLAALLYAMLAGAAPLADATGHHPPGVLRPSIPPHVEAAIMRALSERPSDRFPAILDFVTAVESGNALLREARPTGRASDVILTIPDWQPPETPLSRWKKPALIGVGIAALAVIGTVIALNVGGRPAAIADLPIIEAPSPSPAPAHDSTPPISVSPSPQGSLRVTAPARVQLGLPEPPPAPSSSRGSSRRRNRDTTGTQSQQPPGPAPASAPAPAPAAAPSPAAAAGGGTLFVNAAPWGQLYVDGNLVGNTPKANLAVSAGSHTIRVVRDGFNPVERTVTVAAGQVVRVTDLVLTPHQ